MDMSLLIQDIIVLQTRLSLSTLTLASKVADVSLQEEVAGRKAAQKVQAVLLPILEKQSEGTLLRYAQCLRSELAMIEQDREFLLASTQAMLRLFDNNA